MNRFLYLLFSTLIVCTIAFAAEESTTTYIEFDPPQTIWLTEAQWESLHAQQEKIMATDSFTEIHRQAMEALDRTPSPIEAIYYEGHVSNHPDRIRSAKHLHDMLDIRALLWAYQLTGEERFADKAIEFMHAWAKTYKPTGNDVNENKLNVCFWAYDILGERIPTAQRDTLREWIAEIGRQQKAGWNDGGWNNRHGKRLKLILMISLALDMEDDKQFALEKIRPFMDAALLPDGTTHDLHHRDSMHYNLSCLGGILKLALLFRQDGVNLYTYETPDGATLKSCMEYVLPYARGEKIHAEWVNTKVELDRKRWEAGDPYYRPGKPWDPTQAHDKILMASVFDPSLLELAHSLQPNGEAPLFEHVVLSLLQ